MERKCYNCRNYCSLVNQGYYWCELQKDMDNPETCDGWNANDIGTEDFTSSTTLEI